MSLVQLNSSRSCLGGHATLASSDRALYRDCWPSRVLELTKNDPDWVLGGWITGTRPLDCARANDEHATYTGESLRCLPIMRLLDPSIRPVLRAGWLNVLGQFATTAGAGAQLSNHVAAMWLLANGHVFTPVEVLLVWKPALTPRPRHALHAEHSRLRRCGAFCMRSKYHHVTFDSPLVYAFSLVAAGFLSSTTSEGVQVYSLVCSRLPRGQQRGHRRGPATDRACAPELGLCLCPV